MVVLHPPATDDIGQGLRHDHPKTYKSHHRKHPRHSAKAPQAPPTPIIQRTETVVDHAPAQPREQTEAKPRTQQNKSWYQRAYAWADRWFWKFMDDPNAFFAAAVAFFTLVLLFISRQQNQITRDAMIAGERAFVFPMEIHPVWEQNTQTGEYWWRFRPTWKNSGDTPTRDMIMHSECELRTAPLPLGFNFDYPTTETGKALLPPTTHAWGGIGPRFPANAISPDDILDIQQGRKLLCFWGWARYHDVFPGTPEHITRFCWYILATGDPRAFSPTQPAGPDRLVFSTIHHPEGNCADDECKK